MCSVLAPLPRIRTVGVLDSWCYVAEGGNDFTGRHGVFRGRASTSNYCKYFIICKKLSTPGPTGRDREWLCRLALGLCSRPAERLVL